jgi:5-(carboxyamino)imidazole ribonucleotide mutase
MSREDAAAPVLLLAGSPSDLDTVIEAWDTLELLEIPSRIEVASAHRTPDRAVAIVESAESEGVRVVIAFAGLAAHLAGLAAAHTQLPVIGVPLSGGALAGVDAALATLQMPPGTPLATVGIDAARNAALLAARILAVADAAIRDRLAKLMQQEQARYAPERIAAEVERRIAERRRRAKG